MKKAGIFLVLFVFLVISANANLVSFFIIETGLPENGIEHRHSILWESAFMDVFFDAGFIVGNAPILRLANKPADDILRSASISITDARDWGIDYILIAQLDYTDERYIPVDISFYIYTVSPAEKIMEKQIKRNSNRPALDEYNEIKTIIRGLVPYFRN